MSILRLGKIINVEEFIQYTDIADSLPEVIHKYGSNFLIPDYPCWMTYTNEGGIIGSISFTRNTSNHVLLNNMCYSIAEKLTKIFKSSVVIDPNRIHILKTVGNIVAHRDEAGRKCCINIGLKNADSALTHTSKNQTEESFEKNHQTHALQDGYGYLLNTYEYHAVEALSTDSRYLITYGFGHEFNTIKNCLNIKN